MSRSRKGSSRLFAARLIVALLAATANSQVRSELSIDETRSIPAINISLTVGSPRCDGSSIYFRPYSPYSTSTRLTKVSLDGKEVLQYDVKSAPDFQNPDTFDFAVNYSGDVFFAVQKERTPFVVKFDKYGGYESARRIEGIDQIRQLAVFNSGDLLIAGSRIDTSGDLRPMVGIFDQSGRFLHLLRIAPALLKSVSAENRGETDAEKASTAQSVNLTIAEAGDDGNVYVLRPLGQPTLLVISSAGEVIRTFTLEVPKDARFVNFKVARNRIAAIYQYKPAKQGQNPRKTIRVVEAISGQLIAEYDQGDSPIGPAITCFDGNAFVFAQADDRGALKIVRASPTSSK